MRKLIVTKERFDLSPLPKGVEEAEREVTQSSIPVSFRISAGGAYRVFDEFDEDAITKNKDGSFLIEVHLPNSPWLDRCLLSFGTLLVEVHSKDLRMRLLKEIDEIKDNLK